MAGTDSGRIGSKRGWRRLAPGMLVLGLLPAACASSDLGRTPEPPRPSDSTVGNYLAGRHAQAENDPRAALAFLDASLAADPGNVDLLRRAFLLTSAEGDMKRAVELAAKLETLDTKAPLADMVLAIEDIKRGRNDAAIRRLDKMPDGGINAFVVPLIRAWVEFGRGNVDAAVRTLEKATARESAKPLMHLHTALVSEAAGRIGEAKSHYQIVADSQRGFSLRVAELMGAMLERAGDPAAAKVLYEKYLSERPESRLLADAMARVAGKAKAPSLEVATAPAGVAEGLFGIASSLRQQNARETALILGQYALYLKPNFPVVQVLIGDILEADRRPETANKVYAGIDPKSPFAWPAKLRIATNLDRMDRTDEAIRRLEEYAGQKPADPEPLINLGDILRGRKRFDAAVDAYDRAVARTPDLGPQHWSLLYSRGIALERANKWTRAEKDFLKALEFEPDQPFVLNYLGYSWVEKGMHLDRALAMIKKAVSLRPSDGYIVDSLGWVHYQFGAYEDAVKELERAVELRPDDPVINDHLGDAFWQVGRRHEARFQWHRALGLKPEPDAIDAIRKKLKEGLAELPPKPKRNG